MQEIKRTGIVLVGSNDQIIPAFVEGEIAI